METIQITTVPHRVFAKKNCNLFARTNGKHIPYKSIHQYEKFWACKRISKNGEGVMIFDSETFIMFNTKGGMKKPKDYFEVEEFYTESEGWKIILEECQNNNNLEILIND